MSTATTTPVPPLSVYSASSTLADAHSAEERLIAFELLDPAAEYAWKWYLATMPGPANAPGAVTSCTAIATRMAPHEGLCAEADGSPTRSTPPSPCAVDFMKGRVVEVQPWRAANSLAETIAASHKEAHVERLQTPRESSPTTAPSTPFTANRRKSSTAARNAEGGDVEDSDDDGEASRASLMVSPAASTSVPSTARARRDQTKVTAAKYNHDDEDDNALAQSLSTTHARLHDALHTPRTAEGKALAELIKAKSIAFDARAAEIKAGMREMRKERDEALKAQAEAEQVYKRSQRELRKARKNVEQLDPKHLREVQTYRTPPAAVQWVMKGVMVAMGHPARDWRDITTAMHNPSFIHSVVAFEPANLTPAQRRELMSTYVVKPKFSVEEVNKGSEAVGPMYEWIVKELDMCDAIERLEVVRAEEEKRRERTDAIHARIRSSANELESMDDELCELIDELRRVEEEAAAATQTHGPFGTGHRGGGGEKDNGQEGAGLPSAAALDSSTKAPRSLMRGAFRAWHRPATASAGLTKVLRTSVLCDLGPSPPPGSILTLDPEQRGHLEQAVASRLRLHGASASLAASAVEAAETHEGAPGSVEGAGPTSGAPVVVLQSTETELAASSEETEASVGEHQALAARVRSLLKTLEVANAEVPNESETGKRAPPQTAQLARAVDAAEQRAAAMKAQLATQQAQLSQYELQEAKDAECNPLCEDESMTVTHCVKVFEGEEWDMVLEDAEEALTEALIDDVAVICRVPNRHVSNVRFTLGSLHAAFDVTHSAALRSLHVQDAVDIGEYPSTFGVYRARHAYRAAQQQREPLPPQRPRAGSGETRNALGYETPEWESGFRPIRSPSPGGRIRTSGRTGGGLRGAGGGADSALVSGDSVSLSPRFAITNQTSSQMEVFEEQREQRAFSGMIREAQRLNAKIAERDAQLEESYQQVKDAEARLCQMEVEHARVQDEMRQEIDVLNERVEELQTLHATQAQVSGPRGEQQVHQQRGSAASMPEAQLRALAVLTSAAHVDLVTTHCQKTFDGDEWDVVLEDSPEEVKRAFVDDAAAACGLPNRCFQNVTMTVGRLHVEFDVQHPSDVDPATMQQRIDEADYASLTTVYAGRQDRRKAKKAREEEVAALKTAKEAAEAELHAQRAALDAATKSQQKRSEDAEAALRLQLEQKIAEAERAREAEKKTVEEAAKLQQDLFDKEEELLSMENELRDVRHAKDAEREELMRAKQELAAEMQQQQAAYMAEMNRLHDKVTEAAKAKDRAVKDARRSAETRARELLEEEKHAAAVAQATAALEEAARAKDRQQQIDALTAADATLCAALEADVANKEAVVQFCRRAVDTASPPQDEEAARATRITRLQASAAHLEAALSEHQANDSRAALVRQKVALADELALLVHDLKQSAKRGRDASASTQAALRAHEAAMRRASEQVERARHTRNTLEAQIQAADSSADLNGVAARIAELEALSEARAGDVSQALQVLADALETRTHNAEAALTSVETLFGVRAASSSDPAASAVRARELGADAHADFMREIYALAAARTPGRTDTLWYYVALIGMLAFSIATLEYKKYSI